jgi:hypothetical protein
MSAPHDERVRRQAPGAAPLASDEEPGVAETELYSGEAADDAEGGHELGVCRRPANQRPEAEVRTRAEKMPATLDGAGRGRAKRVNYRIGGSADVIE